ncbi:hypothetical protein N7524_008888 [Penicillium chrysogenum]|nr:hypothetical protein N7524_008888 [Penicillium chrysogenum]
MHYMSEKLGARAFRGHLIGYEGENGHIFKVWNPITKEIVRSRDVTFPDKLDKNTGSDDDQKGGLAPARKPAPKDPDSDDDTGALYEEGGPATTQIEKGKQSFETPKVSTRIQEVEDISPIRQPIFQKPAKRQPMQQAKQQSKQQATPHDTQQATQRPTLQPQARELIRKHMDQLSVEVSVLPPPPPQPRKQATKPLVLEVIPESPIHQSIERDDSEEAYEPISHTPARQAVSPQEERQAVSQQEERQAVSQQEERQVFSYQEEETPMQRDLTPPAAVVKSPTLHLPGAFREDTPQHETPRPVLQPVLHTQQEISHEALSHREEEPSQSISQQHEEISQEPFQQQEEEFSQPREEISRDVSTIENDQIMIQQDRQPSVVTISSDETIPQFIPRRSSRTRRSPERYGFPENPLRPPRPNPPPKPKKDNTRETGRSAG